MTLKIFLTLCVLLLLFLTGCGIENARSSKQPESNRVQTPTPAVPNFSGVKVRLLRVDDTLVENQPVVFRFAIQNDTNVPLNVDLGQDFKGSFAFNLTLPDKREVSLRRYEKNGISSLGAVSIKSRREYSQRVILNEWIDFSLVPGEYVLVGSLLEPLEMDGKIVGSVPSFTVTFHIGSKNSEVLRGISKNLLNKIVQSTSYAEAAEAALELSLIKDAVAAPFLLSALTSNKMVESVIINSLTETGGWIAVDVLMGAIPLMPSTESASHAKSALELIAFRSKDESLKRKILDFLNKSH